MLLAAALCVMVLVRPSGTRVAAGDRRIEVGEHGTHI